MRTTDNLDKLFGLAGSSGVRDDCNDFFDPIGLILQIPPRRQAYWCTPLNCVTFARTGGDGTHYSLVSIPKRRRDQQPVVMTVPMSDDPNVIVGEDLRDFLALGCRTGYFGLEDLVHRPRPTIAKLKRAAYDDDADKLQIRMLKTIATTFELKPWADPRKRLAELKRRFHAALELPPPP